MERATIGDIELEYEISGEGEPVLLIGHVLADALLPLTTEPALAGYQLVRYRKRGFGGSSPMPPPATIAQHAADAVALLEHLGLSPAHVVGASSGGSVALQLAVDHPGAAATLGLLEPSLLSLPSAQAVLAKAAPALEAYGDGRTADAVAMFLSAIGQMDRGECEATLEQQVPGEIARAVDDADTLFGAEVPAVMAWSFGTAEGACIDVPVLSLRGADTGQLWVDIAALLRLCVRDVEECVVEGAGHLLQLQRPEPVARAIAEFLARHPITTAHHTVASTTV
jgi:pimeloyl-ACP methyl ester carboxylesterase